MGGHGALTLYLGSSTNQYRSASAFAPISNPTKCPWGTKAFNGYLQGGVEEAKGRYDATDLVSNIQDPVHILIDYVRSLICVRDPYTTYWQWWLQGTGDKFYQDGQLLPENFLKAARDAGHDEVQVRVRSHEGYDHSYYFVCSTPYTDHPHIFNGFLCRYLRLRPITYTVSFFLFQRSKHVFIFWL